MCLAWNHLSRKAPANSSFGLCHSTALACAPSENREHFPGQQPVHGHANRKGVPQPLRWDPFCQPTRLLSHSRAQDAHHLHAKRCAGPPDRCDGAHRSGMWLGDKRKGRHCRPVHSIHVAGKPARGGVKDDAQKSMMNTSSSSRKSGLLNSMSVGSPRKRFLFKARASLRSAVMMFSQAFVPYPCRSGAVLYQSYEQETGQLVRSVRQFAESVVQQVDEFP